MRNIFIILYILLSIHAVFAQALIKNQYKSVLFLNDSTLYTIQDKPIIKPIQFAGKEIGYHAFYNESHLLHATFIKKEEFFIYEEYDKDGNIVSKGKLIQDAVCCKKDSHVVMSPITLKEIEKYITCYYNLVKIGQWEHTMNDIKTKGNYFDGKKDGVWKSYINDHNLSNIKTYSKDSLLKDSSLNTVNNYSMDSLTNLLSNTWYVTPINKNATTFILEKNTKDYMYDYTLKLNKNNIFEKSNKFKQDNSSSILSGNWNWNDDKSITIKYNDKEIILHILYIDSKEIIVKETNIKI